MTSTQKPARSAKVQKVGTSTILWLTVGKLTTAYRVTPLRSQLGDPAFRLTKANQGAGEPEQYDVQVNGPRSTCECLGFLKHGHCKHVAGLQAIIASGRLPVAPNHLQGRALPDNFWGASVMTTFIIIALLALAENLNHWMRD
jgi:hypothetical protein